jgi:hypothetical protein
VNELLIILYARNEVHSRHVLRLSGTRPKKISSFLSLFTF